VLLVTFGLSGLWHGSAWHFAAWGVFHAVLLFFYRSLGLGGQWRPKHSGTVLLARVAMLLFTVFGWTIFRAPSLAWLSRALFNGVELGVSGDSLAAGLVILVWTAVFNAPKMPKMVVILFRDLYLTSPKKAGSQPVPGIHRRPIDPKRAPSGEARV
jgi:D-alanyl-lipoteichoic acid acyltransferase DltB (MBOAT superfamily)